MTSLLVPIIDDQDRFLGIIGVDFTLESLQQKAAEYTPMGGYVTMVTLSGNYAVHPALPELISQPYGDTAEKQALFAKLETDGSSKAYVKDASAGEALHMLYPINVAGAGVVMYTEAVIPKEQILNRTTRRESLFRSSALSQLPYWASFLLC